LKNGKLSLIPTFSIDSNSPINNLTGITKALSSSTAINKRG